MWDLEEWLAAVGGNTSGADTDAADICDELAEWADLDVSE